MSLKKILGLENAPISERELLAKIQEAKQNNQDTLILNIEGKKITIKLSRISPDGMMRDSYNHV